MDSVEIRAVIKYFFLKGLSATDIHNEMKDGLKDSAPSFSTVDKWVREFKCGRTSVKDAPRSGRPKSATTPEIVEKVHAMVSKDRRLKTSEIAEAVNISKERATYILNEELAMKKLSARWLPRLRSVDQKLVRMQISRECLERFRKNKVDFMRRFITTDETWVHHYTPETKQQSKQWRHSGSPPPKKAKAVASAGKVMASIFWDAKGILLIDYLPKGQTITGVYYASLLDKLKQKVNEKRPGLAKKKIIFHQDNARPHTSVIAMAKIHELGFDLLPHPPYSPDLAPSDYHLFPRLKKYLAGQKFSTDDDVKATVDAYFEELDSSEFYQGIEALDHRWSKCIEVAGDYVEK